MAGPSPENGNGNQPPKGPTTIKPRTAGPEFGKPKNPEQTANRDTAMPRCRDTPGAKREKGPDEPNRAPKAGRGSSRRPRHHPRVPPSCGTRGRGRGSSSRPRGWWCIGRRMWINGWPTACAPRPAPPEHEKTSGPVVPGSDAVSQNQLTSQYSLGVRYVTSDIETAADWMPMDTKIGIDSPANDIKHHEMPIPLGSVGPKCAFRRMASSGCNGHCNISLNTFIIVLSTT